MSQMPRLTLRRKKTIPNGLAQHIGPPRRGDKELRMKRLMIIVFTILFLAASILVPETLEERIKNISRQEMQSVVEFLSHDLVEGRAPGTRGGNLAETYIKSLFKWMDLKPELNNQYLQPFVLKGFTIKELAIETNNMQFNYIDDVVGVWVGKEAEFELEREAVFVGFGITTDLWNWDDYKNVDVKNKFVITQAWSEAMGKSSSPFYESLRRKRNQTLIKKLEET